MATKRCSTCSTDKPIEEFSVSRSRKDGRQRMCKLCFRAYLSDYYDKNRERIIRRNTENNLRKKPRVKAYLVRMLGGVCQGCHQPFPDGKLHFHHRDPSTKRFQIGEMKTASLELLEEEVAKCDLLCQDCHTAAHAKRGDLGKRKAAA